MTVQTFKIVSLYDEEDWAIHNFGQLIAPHLTARGHEFLLIRSDRYHARPVGSDILHFGYSGLFRRRFNYRRFSRRLVATVHDPCEISNFTNRFNWSDYPLRRLPLDEFDRIAVTSKEMLRIVSERYSHARLYCSPTFPHDAELIGKGAGIVSDVTRPMFFSSTNAFRLASFRSLAGRVLELPNYLFDHRGHFSWLQLRSIVIRTHRKNIALLQELESHIQRHPHAGVFFNHSRSAKLNRNEYLRCLHESDVYVCTSYMEGGPLPVMEAVLAGLAVLTTKVGQVEDWVENGKNGYVCATAEEFKERIDAYVADPSLLKRHREMSTRIARSKAFDARAWHSFFTGAVENHAGQRL